MPAPFYRWVDKLAIAGINAGGQRRIGEPIGCCQSGYIGCQRGRQGLRCRSRHGSRHISDPKMDHVVFHKRGILISGRSGSRHTTALVHCNIHNHGARFHGLHHVLGYQCRCHLTGDKCGTHQQVGSGNRLLQ